MTGFRFKAVAAVGIIGVLGACADQPRGMRGEFTLKGSTSDTLPLLAQRDALCLHTVDSGSIVFHGDTLYTSSMHMTHVCKGYQTARDDFGVKKGRYRMAGDTLLFYNNTKALTGMTVVLDPDTLIIQGPRHILVYARR